MTNKAFSIIITLSFFLLGFTPPKAGSPDDGETLFMSNCAACHAPNRGVAGPPFQQIRKDYEQGWIYGIIRNHDSVCNSFDIRARYLNSVWGNVRFNNTFHLSDAEITSILDFVDSKPLAKDYYRHRKMSDEELGAVISYIQTITIDTNIEHYIHLFDSLHKI